ncbi:hypothetical protein P9112_004740 [Eukaryota sp. TZLM1-RC]
MLEEETSRRVLAAFQAKDRTIAELRSSLADVRSKRDDLAAQLSSSNQQYESVIQQLENKLHLLSSTSSTSPTDTSTKLIQTGLTYTDIHELLESNEQKTSELTELHSKLSKANSSLSDLRASKKDLLLSLSEKEKELETCYLRIEKLSALDSQSSSIIQRQNIQLSKQTERLSELQSELSIISQSAQKEVADMSVQTVSQEFHQSQSKSDLELTQLKEACRVISRLRQECSNYMNKCAEFEVQMEIKSKELSQLSHDNNLLEAKLGASMHDQESLIQEYNILEEQLSKVKEDYKSEEVSRLEILGRVSQVEAERDSLARQVRLLREEVETIRKERDQLNIDYDKCQNELETVRKELSDCQEQEKSFQSVGIQVIPFRKVQKYSQTDPFTTQLPVFPSIDLPDKTIPTLLSNAPAVSNWFGSAELEEGVSFVQTVIEVLEEMRNVEGNCLESINQLQSDTMATVITSRAHLAALSPRKIRVNRAASLISGQKSIISDLRRRVSFYERSITKMGGMKAKVCLNASFIADVSLQKILKLTVLSNRIALLNKRNQLITAEREADREKFVQLLQQYREKDHVEVDKAKKVTQKPASNHSERKRLLTELKEQKETNSRMINEVSGLKSKIKQLSHDVKRKDNLLETLRPEVEALREEKEAFSSVMESEHSKLSHLQKEVSKLNSKLQQHRSRTDSRNEDQVDVLRTKISELESVVGEKRNEIKMLNSRLKNLTETLKAQKKTIQDLTSSLKTNKEESNSLSEKVEFLESQVSSLKLTSESQSKSIRKKVNQSFIDIIRSIVKVFGDQMQQLITFCEPKLRSKVLDPNELSPSIVPHFSRADIQSILSTSPVAQIQADSSTLLSQLEFCLINGDYSQLLTNFQHLLLVFQDLSRLSGEVSGHSVLR